MSVSDTMRIVFVLPSAGGGGGAHSIVQEAAGLARLGVDVAIASPEHLAVDFRLRYAELQGRGVANPTYASIAGLSTILSGADLVVATTALSVDVVVEASEAVEPAERPKLVYYVQDYEPLFYSPGSDEWIKATRSFEQAGIGLIFAKTDWLRNIVEANHGVLVRRVQASIDHETYYPVHRPDEQPIRVTAMVRPQTARRAPRRTLRILERIAFAYPDAQVSFFGCDGRDLDAFNLQPSSALGCHGVLTQAQVATLLRHSDLFLDLSDYQAFGRTGLEGMACGCVPILPIFGGAEEYAEHLVNGFLVDTRSDEEIMLAVAAFLDGGSAQRALMRTAGIETALRYSVSRAAFSEYRLFRDYLGPATSHDIVEDSETRLPAAS